MWTMCNGAPVAAARPGPADACLARRLEAAGRACRGVVDAWATWTRTGNAEKRDKRSSKKKASKKSSTRAKEEKAYEANTTEPNVEAAAVAANAAGPDASAATRRGDAEGAETAVQTEA